MNKPYDQHTKLPIFIGSRIFNKKYIKVKQKVTSFY